jgi:hypothetical protein
VRPFSAPREAIHAKESRNLSLSLFFPGKGRLKKKKKERGAEERKGGRKGREKKE